MMNSEITNADTNRKNQSDSLFTLDDDYDDEGESDLFGRIPISTTPRSNSGLFADVDKALQEGEDDDLLNNTNDRSMNEAEEKLKHVNLGGDTPQISKQVDPSFYRSHENNAIDDPLGSNTVYYSVSYDEPPPIPATAPPEKPPSFEAAHPTPYPMSDVARATMPTPSAAYAAPAVATAPKYEKVTVHDPRFQSSSGLFGGASYWSYAVTTTWGSNGVEVRRRFRHFVALEDRLRKVCPGAILPPRPEKNPLLSDEAIIQTMSFAKSRASLLQTYLNALIHHPLISHSAPLHTFLTLKHDLGAAWPEVSTSAFTRLGAKTSTTTWKLTEAASTTALKETYEPNEDMRAILNSEHGRLSVISQSVPKINGFVALLKEYGQLCGSTGMEMNKLVKDLKKIDKTETQPEIEGLSMALLRSSRRTKRFGQVADVAVSPFDTEFRSIPSFEHAFMERKRALSKRESAHHLLQTRTGRYAKFQNQLDVNRMAQTDNDVKVALMDLEKADKEADEIFHIIASEVSRLECDRRRKWEKGTKMLVEELVANAKEQRAIWEGALEKIKQI